MISKRGFFLIILTIGFLLLTVLHSLANPDDPSALPGVSLAILAYFVCFIFLKRTVHTVPVYAPWVFYPPAVMLYYLLEPVLQLSIISTSQPDYIALLVAYFLVFFVLGVSTIQFIPNKLSSGRAYWLDERRVFISAVIMFAMALVVNIFVAAKFGFLPLRPDFEVFRTELPQHISGYFTYIMYLSVPAAILLLSVSEITENKNIKKISLILGIFCVLLPLHTGNRTRFFITIITVQLVRWFYLKKWPTLLQISVFIGMGIVVMGLVGAVRLSSFKEGSLLELGVIKMSGELGLGAYSLDRIVTRIGNEYVTLNWLLAPYASLLPGKDITLVRHLKDVLSMTFVGGGFTPTIVGSFYIYGGTIAVMIGGYVYGLIQGAVFKMFTSERTLNLKYWKSVIFFFNVVYTCVNIKNGFLISIESTFYFVALVGVMAISLKKSAG